MAKATKMGVSDPKSLARKTFPGEKLPSIDIVICF